MQADWAEYITLEEASIKELVYKGTISGEGNQSLFLKGVLLPYGKGYANSEEIQFSSKTSGGNSILFLDNDSFLPGQEIELVVHSILSKHNARPSAHKYIIEDLKKMSVMENDRLVLKNHDGTTLRLNGKDASLEDIVQNMREKALQENNPMFFEISPQKSGAEETLSGRPTDESDLFLY